jgi:hypothetical protein
MAMDGVPTIHPTLWRKSTKGSLVSIKPAFAGRQVRRTVSEFCSTLSLLAHHNQRAVTTNTNTTIDCKKILRYLCFTYIIY